ncbi:hypothetical protein [Lacunimicrobium album]
MKVTIALSPISFVAGCLVTALAFQTFGGRSPSVSVATAPVKSVHPNQVAMSEDWLLTDSVLKPSQDVPLYRQPDPLPALPNALPIEGSDEIEELLKSIPPDDKVEQTPVKPATPDELSKILSNQDEVTKEVFSETFQDLTAEQAAELMKIRAQVEGPRE